MQSPTTLDGSRLRDGSVGAKKLAEEVRLPLSKIQSIEASISTVETARDEAVAAAGIAVEAMLSQGDVVGPLEQFIAGIGDGLLLGGGEWVGGLDPNLNASEIGALFDAGYESA